MQQDLRMTAPSDNDVAIFSMVGFACLLLMAFPFIILQDVKPLKDQMDEAVKTLDGAQKQLAVVTAKVAKLEQDLAVLNADLAAATKSKAEAEADAEITAR